MSEMTKVQLEHETTRHLDTIQETADRGAEIIQKLRATIAAAEKDDRYSAEHKRELTVKAREEAQGELDKLRGSVAASQKAVRDSLGNVTRQPADTNEALLREQQMGRAWARMKAQLDAGTDPTTVINRAVSDGDRAGVHVLREELPAYLRASTRGGDGDRNVDEIIEGTLANLGEMEKPLLSRLDLSAREVSETLEKASYFAGMSVNSVTDEVTGKGPALVLPRSQTDVINLSAA